MKNNKEIIINDKRIPFKRINIFAGHYGSGKTEIAVNFSLMLAEKGLKTAIVDLDIVNPYFRTADAVKILEENGVKVIVPMYANTNVDVPSLPPEIYTIFENKDYHVVLDVGGDDLGAKAIARFKREITNDDSEFFFVINTKRPFTNTIEKINEMFDEISISSGIFPGKLVNNANLLAETDGNVLLEGQKMIRHFSNQRGIPLAFTAMLRSVYDNTRFDINELESPILLMDKTVKTPWD